MIAFVDYDAIFFKKIEFPKLALMQLASYYRQQRKRTVMLLELKNLELYEEVHFFQDHPKIPIPRIFNLPNVYWYGIAFTGGKETPIKSEISQCSPIVDIYKPIFKEFLLKEYIDFKHVTYLLNASYGRLTQRLNKKYLRTIKKNRRIIIYDINVFQGEWKKNARILTNRGVLGFHFIHRQTVKDIKVLREALTEWPRTVFGRNNIYYETPVIKKNIMEFAKLHKDIRLPEDRGYYQHIRLKINMKPSYRENSLNLALFIADTHCYKWACPTYYKDLDYNNPYWAVVRQALRWRNSRDFFTMSFFDYCLSHKRIEGARPARWIMNLSKTREDVRVRLMEKPIVRYEQYKEIMEAMKKYDERRNHESPFRALLQLTTEEGDLDLHI